LCGVAPRQQLDAFHSTGLDSLIFGIGLALIVFKAVRRMVWLFLGLTLLWSTIVVGVTYLQADD
jgi:hypothetical protein